MHRPRTFSVTVVGENDTTGGGVFEFDASVLLLRSEHLSLWVGDDHFVVDPEGDVQRGQYVLVERPSSGCVARIVEVDSGDAPDSEHRIEVECCCRWDATHVETDPTIEYWTQDMVEAGSRKSERRTRSGHRESEKEGETVTFVRPTMR
ncbi:MULTISPECIES: hypothetical protein [Haloferax]|uniref:Uncharacterized protein n=2 Tax=Haloferax TaxID=2251 RepID=A0A6G1Z6P3_9EURY|nr:MULTISPECIES: hypothetical protein [Haloferax]KAB1185036.1 hypothetical protein Hfx1149_16060 [Haloferax sp. CBA1149]MRW82212.1 hypothetical protein [Haloferax marinisediminis]